MLYCGSGNGRINSGVVAAILKEFIKAETPVFYIITNLYSHSDETLSGQISGAQKIMSWATEKKPTEISNLAWKFEYKGFIVAVKSKQFSSIL